MTRKLNGTTQLAIAYNNDNRPKTAATETYTYDGFGKRVLIGVPSASTQDIFDPASGRLLVENNAGAQPQRTYIYLNGIPIALVSGFSSINYVLSDQLGQPQKLVDGFATLVWDRVSDPFGLTSSQAKGISTAISLRFPGQEYDAITGLHYNDQRDYDPTLGRYIQPDPIGLAGGINIYAYASNDPLRHFDPRGTIFGVDNAFGGAIGVLVDLAAQYAKASMTCQPFHYDVFEGITAFALGFATSGLSSAVSTAIEGDAVSAILARAIANAAIGSGGSLAQTAILNNFDNQNNGYVRSAVGGAALGALGSVASDFISGTGSTPGIQPSTDRSVGLANELNNILQTSGMQATTRSSVAGAVGTAVGSAIGALPVQ